MWAALHLNLGMRVTGSATGDGAESETLQILRVLRMSSLAIDSALPRLDAATHVARHDQRTEDENEYMANQALIPQSEQEELHLLPRTSMDESLWSSLKENIRAAFFPEKLPPLQLTSRPVQVREIWGEYNYKKQSAGVSLVVHILMVAGLIALSIMGARR